LPEVKNIHVKKWYFGNASLSLVALLVVLIVVGAAALSTIQSLNEAWRWEKHTYEVIGELGRLLSNLVDVETAVRGYAISGDQKFLEPFNNARPQIDGRVQNLRRLTIDNAIQQRRLEQLGPLIEKRIAETQQVIYARANGDSEVAQMRVPGGEGKRLMDAIRQIIAEMENEEQRLLSDRSHAANAAVQRLQGALYGSGALGVLIAVLSFLLTARERRKRREAEVSASRTLSILDFTLDSVLMFKASTLRFFYVNKGRCSSSATRERSCWE
jgi:CHASE3 domain sensor protein